MSKLEFKAEMFQSIGSPEFRFSAKECATFAQAIYDKHVAGLPKVRGWGSPDKHGAWTYEDSDFFDDTADK